MVFLVTPLRVARRLGSVYLAPLAPASLCQPQQGLKSHPIGVLLLLRLAHHSIIIAASLRRLQHAYDSCQSFLALAHIHARATQRSEAAVVGLCDPTCLAVESFMACRCLFVSFGSPKQLHWSMPDNRCVRKPQRPFLLCARMAFALSLLEQGHDRQTESMVSVFILVFPSLYFKCRGLKEVPNRRRGTAFSHIVQCCSAGVCISQDGSGQGQCSRLSVPGGEGGINQRSLQPRNWESCPQCSAILCTRTRFSQACLPVQQCQCFLDHLFGDAWHRAKL